MSRNPQTGSRRRREDQGVVVEADHRGQFLNLGMTVGVVTAAGVSLGPLVAGLTFGCGRDGQS
jgi:hypothetical protein